LKEVWGDDYAGAPQGKGQQSILRPSTPATASFEAFEKEFYPDSPSRMAPRKQPSRSRFSDQFTNNRMNKQPTYCSPEYKQMFADDSTIDTTTTAMTDQSEVMPILKNRKIRVEAFSDAPPMKRVPKKEKDVKEHFSNHVKPTDCVGILEHIQECPICSMEYNELSHGTFFREFILFAGSGILMFLFLDLIHRIKK